MEELEKQGGETSSQLRRKHYHRKFGVQEYCVFKGKVSLLSSMDESGGCGERRHIDMLLRSQTSKSARKRVACQLGESLEVPGDGEIEKGTKKR